MMLSDLCPIEAFLSWINYTNVYSGINEFLGYTCMPKLRMSFTKTTFHSEKLNPKNLLLVLVHQDKNLFQEDNLG
jgi:hypothetical protein